MKNDRFRWVFLLILALCLAFAPPARAQEVEVEPNNPCSSAQDLTASSAPLTITGNLDTPDVDFYRISAPPGTVLRVSLQGQSSGQGTLGDLLLGAFSPSPPGRSWTSATSALLPSPEWDRSGAGWSTP